jgi:hypothetical protein
MNNSFSDRLDDEIAFENPSVASTDRLVCVGKKVPMCCNGRKVTVSDQLNYDHVRCNGQMKRHTAHHLFVFKTPRYGIIRLKKSFI